MSYDFLTNLGIQSYCFRGFKNNSEVAEKLKECGVQTVELCGVHADFTSLETFEPALEAYRQAGVQIASLGVQGFHNNAPVEEQWFECAQAAGAHFLSVDFQPESSPASWRTAEELADKYDMRLGIHNHGGRHWLGSAKMLEHVMNNTSERIGLCLDTAWALDSRENPVKMAERFADRLYGVHIKDFVFEPTGKGVDVVIGEGNLDLPAFFKVLNEKGFKGFAVIEYEGDIENPVPALTQCVKAANSAWQSIL